jgi:predicted ABC-type ATPase
VLNTPELAIQRVQTRVAKGGHNIPEEVIRGRYKKGLQNFVNLFMPICDKWIMADNSHSLPQGIAQGTKEAVELIHQPDLWKQILIYGH